MGGGEVESVSDRNGLARCRNDDSDLVGCRQAVLGDSDDDQRIGVSLLVMVILVWNMHIKGIENTLPFPSQMTKRCFL